MKKGILIAAFLLIGIVGLFRQITAPKITLDEVFSTGEEREDVQQQPQEAQEEIIQDDAENEPVKSFPYDQRGQELPSEASESEGEYYTEGIDVQVYFSDTDKSSLSGILPAAAMDNLNHDIQAFLNDSGYTAAGELTVTGLEDILGKPGFTFQSGAYSDTLFRAYWDGESLRFEAEES